MTSGGRLVATSEAKRGTSAIAGPCTASFRTEALLDAALPTLSSVGTLRRWRKGSLDSTALARGFALGSAGPAVELIGVCSVAAVASALPTLMLGSAMTTPGLLFRGAASALPVDTLETTGAGGVLASTEGGSGVMASTDAGTGVLGSTGAGSGVMASTDAGTGVAAGLGAAATGGAAGVLVVAGLLATGLLRTAAPCRGPLAAALPLRFPTSLGAARGADFAPGFGIGALEVAGLETAFEIPELEARGLAGSGLTDGDRAAAAEALLATLGVVGAG